ncbi:glucose sorbosone dehydrogenase [Candidatus Kaiserbacteria bacterium CG10_big_fil_rev_8_21_14_0_10_59_10]|uniref:Glucose sorbosone dehydrogenase n=1 Tax=Candidatus Kaiserbacteria bacterium CG10_big_fil_rev_8_21_14_0_10_59_10 TaxID=1974612 RepID=A0A2H0U8N2_9BACT|nr:MAG: glucose sorbosone dehydrogenase [Candidatus Kaiserbacteria bacterium CG10_big_fil_rev_8_21_14_0_10_59_10]
MSSKMLLVAALLVLGAVVLLFLAGRTPEPTRALPAFNGGTASTENETPVPDVEVIADNLEIPWDVAFLPEGGYLVTERAGRLIHIAADGSRRALPIEGVRTGGEGGLLGIALHPAFADNRLLYLYLTATAPSGTVNRVERFRFESGTLSDRTVIIDDIPGASYHDGGRIAFGPDQHLYITTGDAGRRTLSQERNSLAGKILRVRADGGVAPGNPYGTAVYSWGHRNPQGLAWDEAGRLWSTEHGRSGALSGFDEINLIERGANYGWPEIEGDERRAGMRAPILHSGARTTWAPASAAILGNSLFFGGLRGETLYEAVLEGERVVELREHFAGSFGRIRTVRVGPDGFLYITTSNLDGRGTPRAGDDKLMRINPASL